jgi:hypothetical protein
MKEILILRDIMMLQKETPQTLKEDFSVTVQKTIDDLVEIFKAPPKPLNVEKKAEHYFVIG